MSVNIQNRCPNSPLEQDNLKCHAIWSPKFAGEKLAKWRQESGSCPTIRFDLDHLPLLRAAAFRFELWRRAILRPSVWVCCGQATIMLMIIGVIVCVCLVMGFDWQPDDGGQNDNDNLQKWLLTVRGSFGFGLTAEECHFPN